ncbi:MAG: iron-sulfur cluster co-chaperone HscB C-terminal domain-containing protein [Bacteroidota bacterium]|nr:iron-sulfur cluster co-chaperone HscB C-terminal domain-containing protein [Bacteroidota bacterium]
MKNYYKFYGLPVKLNLDLALLKQKFFEISRNYHPDLFANSTPAEQDKALQISTENTIAYKTLLNTSARLQHVLQLFNIDTNQPLSPMFLGEMMDLNEQIDDITADTFPALRREIEELKKGFDAEMLHYFEKFDAASEVDKSSILLNLNQLHLKSKYLLRLNESLNTFAAD